MIFKGGGGGGELNGFVDAGSRFDGELHFETAFRIDGKVAGTIVSDGNLVVGEGGEVEGEVLVGQVFVSGAVRGRIQAARRIQLAPTARVTADLETPSLVIEDGAVFEGRCTMQSTPQRERRGVPAAEEGGRVLGPVKAG